MSDYPMTHPATDPSTVRLRDAERFVGLPYIDGQFDCADLAVRVQRELFGRDVPLPSERRRPGGVRGQGAEIGRWRDELARRVTTPRTGDGVLLWQQADEGGVMWHIGTAFVTDDAADPWVLHNSHHLGSAHLQRLSLLRSLGLRLEGYYQWLVPAKAGAA